MAKVDIKSLLSRDKREEVQADKIGKQEIVRAVQRYPKDTPEEYDEIGWEDLMDPL
jgi:hypothetical protein